MKSIFVVISVVSALPVSAADPQPFAPAPFQLELPRAAPLAATYAPVPVLGVRHDLPIGPVRIDYGIPIRSSVQSDAPRGYHFLDAPGPEYRDQRARTNNK